MATEKLEQGFVFWPIGTGDSTTIIVRPNVIMEIDLRHMQKAEEDDDPHCLIVDRLIELLPLVNDKPYLSVFVLTHPDEDHCLGFDDLLKRVLIGEIWFTPRVFLEYTNDLCDDALAFQKEAIRRVRKTIDSGGNVASGDRVRIIGYADLLKSGEYNGFPEDQLTIPGDEICDLDGLDQSDVFRAFIHAPFKDDVAGDRNDTSLGCQITLFRDDKAGKALFLGDHTYPVIDKIIQRSEAKTLEWNILLAPHHCSKSVMYWQDEEDNQESIKQHIMSAFAKGAMDPGYIIASCEPIPANNEPGDNPPHAIAKHQYEKIAPDGFLCTQEHQNEDSPDPIIFRMSAGGLQYLGPDEDGKRRKTDLGAAIKAARGSNEPPTERVGLGRVDD